MIYRAATLQLVVFLLLSLFWYTKQQRTSPQPTSQRSRHSLHNANNHAIHTTTPPSTTTLPPSSQLAILNTHRAVTISAGRMEGAGVAATRAQRNISRPKLPPKPPAQNSCANISRPKLPCLVVVLSEKRGRGGASSPDWWMRGVTRPGREGGARNGAGRKVERRAEPRLTKGETRRLETGLVDEERVPGGCS